MKKLSFLVSSLVLTCSLNANVDLIKEAKDFGLMPIPNNENELNKLIRETAPDSISNPTTRLKVELGKKLYFEPRISKSNLISCNTCHNLGLGGTDVVGAAVGHKWTANPSHLNSPTTLNSVFNTVQFWDGRSAHLSDQAQGPIQAGPEMAAPAELVVEKVNSIPGYVKEFKQAYGSDVKIDFKLIADTIAVFERTLITPSRFDAFLHGNTNALNKSEKEGLRLFLDKGCVACHIGVNLGGTMSVFEQAAKYNFAALGNYKGDENGLIKTPTLRNVEITAPYFHNGAIWSLKEAIKTMGSVQLGIKINDKEASLLESFLNSLTGKLDRIEYPILPKLGEKTPNPSFN